MTIVIIFYNIISLQYYSQLSIIYIIFYKHFLIIKILSVLYFIKLMLNIKQIYILLEIIINVILNYLNIINDILFILLFQTITFRIVVDIVILFEQIICYFVKRQLYLTLNQYILFYLLLSIIITVYSVSYRYQTHIQ